MRRPGFRPMKIVMRLGERESVRWFGRCAYLDGGAYLEERRIFFLKGEEE